MVSSFQLTKEEPTSFLVSLISSTSEPWAKQSPKQTLLSESADPNHLSAEPLSSLLSWLQHVLQGTTRVLCLKGKLDYVSVCRELFTTSPTLREHPQILSYLAPPRLSNLIPFFSTPLCSSDIDFVLVVEASVKAVSSVWNVPPCLRPLHDQFHLVSQFTSQLLRSFFIMYHFSHHPEILVMTPLSLLSS